MATHSLTLLLSGVETHLQDDAQWPPMPALQTLLSKGRQEPLPVDYATCLCELFQQPSHAGGDWPVAPISALGDGLDAAGGWWLRADPVHLVADRDQLYLSACQTLAVTREEADELVTELNRLYAEDGWHFVAVTPGRWYLRLPQPLAMRTVPTGAAMGCRVGEVLPQGEDALVWQRSMTEMQMLLHASPVNAQRSERGLLTINSLWFWGGGSLPAAQQGGWSQVSADDPLALGLAQLDGIRAETTSMPDVDTLASAGEQALWQVTATSLVLLEQRLFAPLLDRLRSGELTELTILLPGIGSWHLNRAALRRWWRRRKSLPPLLKGAG